MHWMEFGLTGVAAVAGGAVNALAGGGTLITFPMLTAVGVPAVAANITNTVALCPGYLGATFAQMKDLKGQNRRLRFLLPVSVLGGIAGGILLLHTGEHTFRTLVPFLILLAAGLLVIQDPVRKWLMRRSGHAEASPLHESWASFPVFIAAIYGGYFGAGLSVIVLAVLGLVIEDTMTRLNGLKQAIAFSTNIATAIFFLFSGRIVWSVVFVMAVGSLIGGALGGRLAGKISAVALRRVVVLIGVVVAGIYLLH